MASGASQQTVTLGAGTIVLADPFTVTINGSTYTYLAVAADVSAGGVASTAARIAAGWNALPIPGFTASTEGGLTITVASTNNSYNASSFSAAHSGSGSAPFGGSVPNPYLVGGDGGANIGLQSSGGATGGQAIFPVMAAGFNSPIGNTYIKSTQG
jgi:hypothetical protein